MSLIVLGHRDVLRRDRRRHRPRRRRATDCWPTRSPRRVDEHARFGGVVPEVASRAHLRGDGARRCTGRWRRPGVDARATSTPSPSPPGPGLAGALLVGVAAAKAYAAALGRAALRRQPPRRARRRRHPAARPAPAVPRAARLRRALQPARRAGHRGPGHAARRARSTTRRARRSTRSPGCSACRSRAARTSTGSPATATPRRSRSRAGSPARGTRPFDFSFSGLKTAVARHVEALRAGGRRRCRWPTSRRASRRPWSTCSPRRPCARPASTAWTRCCSAAGWRPTRGCGRWPRSAAPRPGSRCACRGRGLCTDNGAMVAALGAHLVAAGAKPSPLDLPADSSLPVTQVLVG